MRAAAWQSHVPWPYLSLTAASKIAPFQGTLTQQPSSFGLELPQSEGLGSGVGIKTVFGSLSTCYAKNPSLKLQFFSEAIPGFALLKTMGSFAWGWPFSSSLPCEGAVSIFQGSFFHILSVLYIYFPIPFQAAWGGKKWSTQGLTEGKQIVNTVWIRKIIACHYPS